MKCEQTSLMESFGGHKIDRAENDDSNSRKSLADEMKEVEKVKLRRRAVQDPQLQSRLIKIESSPVYNTRGEIIQAVSTKIADA